MLVHRAVGTQHSNGYTLMPGWYAAASRTPASMRLVQDGALPQPVRVLLCSQKYWVLTCSKYKLRPDFNSTHETRALKEDRQTAPARGRLGWGHRKPVSPNIVFAKTATRV